MNVKQKKLLTVFLILESAIILTISGIIAYAAYQKQLAKHGDIFDKVAAEQHMEWISPTLIILSGIAVTAVLMLIGFWKILKPSEKNKD